MAEVEFKFSFDKAPDMFDIEGKQELRDEKGGLTEGFQYRWCLEDDRNIASKKNQFGYEPCLQSNVKAPFGQNSDGVVPRIKNGNESFMLMYRPVEIMKQEAQMYREYRKEAMTDTNRMDHEGVTSKFKVSFEKPGAAKAPRGYVKSGR